jgi:FkbM family methyltransferase
MTIKTIKRNGVEFLVNYGTKNSSFWDIEGWEKDNYDLILSLSEKVNTFVHAGGWIGPFTLFASKIYDRVISLEPDPVAYEELKTNIEVNDFKNIVLINKAFNNTDDKIRIGSDYGLGVSDSSIFKDTHSVEVEVCTVRKVYEEYNITEPTLLMFDVEGSEYKLFDDFYFYEKYRPYIILSLHLSWLNDENFNYMMNGITNLYNIYDFDLNYILEMRKLIPYQSSFSEVNVLLSPKTTNQK